MIQNPILPGFHSDPCLCRRGEDYYLACSTFEWFPGIPVYHSRDLKHWELQTHLLRDAGSLGLRGLPSAKGIWAPCLSWCEKDGLFYLVYGVMRSMNARLLIPQSTITDEPVARSSTTEQLPLLPLASTCNRRRASRITATLLVAFPSRRAASDPSLATRRTYSRI